MKAWITVIAALGSAVLAGGAHAIEVVPYTMTSLGPPTGTQHGRLSRARPPSNWAAPTPFLGFVNTAKTYRYRTFAVSFAPNAFQDVYYEISVDDRIGALFASAYNGAYDKNNPGVGYLGDEGSSGNYFPGDPSFFDVIVPKGGSLLLVFNGVGFGIKPFAYQVSAFSDSMYDENFRTTAAPEPGAWALMTGGFGLVGLSLRRRRRTVKAVAG